MKVWGCCEYCGEEYRGRELEDNGVIICPKCKMGSLNWTENEKEFYKIRREYND